MKYYEVQYIIRSKRGKKIIQAQNKLDALNIAKLNKLGVIVKIIETSPPKKEQFEILKDKLLQNARIKSIKLPDLIAAIRQLSVMTSAGISIHDSIKEVANATENKHLKNIFQKLDDDLNIGSSLTESLIPFESQLGEVTIAMVRLGESTGNMGESLSKLANIQEDIWDNAQKFKKAIRYPITVIIAIAIAFIILMLYVVPRFKEIFKKLEAELPMPTKILLGIENILSNYGLFMLGGIIFLIIFTRFMYASNEKFKYFIDKHILSVYLIGKIIFYSTMSRFQLIFTQLIKAGIPIAQALDTSLITIENTHLEKKLKSVKISVQKGVSLTDAFRDTNLYEGMLIQMIRAGEASGNLDAMLEKVTDYYKSKFRDIIDNISSYIEPILIGFLSLMVLLMALGIFMPMWDMAQAIKG
ncbi:MAG: type II secretion system protein F [Proteobacteria bacterium]|nr:MAG: type II secretion system protein F [Pseudomonadota bacterium]